MEPVHAGGTTDLSVEMKSPSIPGIYQSEWRMVTPTGSYFGGILYCNILILNGMKLLSY